jgi:shikimate dehydrogenase
MEISARTRVFALLGDPVSQSLSPAMQNAAFRALGLDAVYVALRCEAASLGAVMASLVRQGGGGNVTIPYKRAAARLLAAGHAPPGEICNTFWGRGDVIEGCETDSVGIQAALAGLDAPAGDWCLVGTGGSARAALMAAKYAGARVAIRSRTRERAEQFMAVVRAAGVESTDVARCRVAINCTPLGLHENDPLPVSAGELASVEAVLDLVYRRGETAWVRAMRQAGFRAADGRGVLVEQGAAAFERWFPGRVAPREVMRAAVREALA